MKYLEEKAIEAAKWSLDLVTNGFSVHKTFQELIDSDEELLDLIKGKKSETYKFYTIKVKEMKRLQYSIKYYSDEFNRLDVNERYPYNLKITGIKYTTKNISINKYSAKALVDWLTKSYLKD